MGWAGEILSEATEAHSPAPHRRPAPTRRTQWRILFGATAVLALTGPGQTAGLSVFTEPLIHDLEISRTQLSGAYLAATLSGA
ncbi:hypothetical protein E1289_37740, partial [Actinomadura sp. 6K520]